MKVLKKVLSVLVVASIVFGSALSCPVGAIATDVSAQAVDQILDLSENPNTSSSQDDSILDISGDGAEGSSASSNADAQGEEDAQLSDAADVEKVDNPHSGEFYIQARVEESGGKILTPLPSGWSAGSYEDYASKTVATGSTYGELPTPSYFDGDFVDWQLAEPVKKYERFMSDKVVTLDRSYMYTDKISIHLEAYMDNWADFASEQMRLISCTQSGGFNIQPTGDGKFVVYMKIGSGDYTTITSTMKCNQVSPGWHSFDVVYTGSTLNFYIDDVEQASKNVSGAITYHASNAIFIGSEAGANTTTPEGNYFRGAIRNVIIANLDTPTTVRSDTIVTKTSFHSIYATWTPKRNIVTVDVTYGALWDGNLLFPKDSSLIKDYEGSSITSTVSCTDVDLYNVSITANNPSKNGEQFGYTQLVAYLESGKSYTFSATSDKYSSDYSGIYMMWTSESDLDATPSTSDLLGEWKFWGTPSISETFTCQKTGYYTLRLDNNNPSVVGATINYTNLKLVENQPGTTKKFGMYPESTRTFKPATLEGYTYLQWIRTESGNPAYTEISNDSNGLVFSNCTKDCSIRTSWQGNEYTITLDNQNATTPGTTSFVARFGNNLTTITVPTKVGYTFGGYFTQTNGNGKQYFSAKGTSSLQWDIASDSTLYAKWTVNTITINYHENGGTTATRGQVEGDDGSINYTTTSWNANDYGSSGVMFNTTPPTGYTATGNYLVGKADSTTKIGMNEEMSAIELATKAGKAEAFKTGNITVDLYAEWVSNAFTLTANANSGSISSTTGWIGTGATATKSVNAGSAYGTLPTATRTGYTLKGWYTAASGGTAVSTTTTMGTANATIYAQWTPNTYTLTANANSGSISSTTGWTGTGATATKSITYGSTYGTLPTVSRTGYTLTGWLGKPNLFDMNQTAIYPGYYIDVNGNKVVNAEFSVYKINVSPNTQYTLVNSGMSGTPSYVIYNSSNQKVAGEAYNSRGTITFTTPATASYVYVSVVTLAGNYRYDKDKFRLERSDMTGSFAVTSSTTVSKAYSHQIVAQWTINKSSVTAYAMRVVGSNIVNDAVGGKVNVGDSSATYGATSTYTCNYNNVYTVRALALTGYKFDGWYRDSALTTEATDYVYEQGGLYENTYYYRRFYKQDKSETIYAKFTPITYTVAYNGNGATGGSTASSTHTYNVAKALTTNGFTRTGYTFAGWNTKADGTGTNYTNGQSVTNLSSTQGATITLYAKWSQGSYTLTIDPDGGTYDGKTTNTTVNQNYGTTYNFKADPTKTGYAFTGWTKVSGPGTFGTSAGSNTNVSASIKSDSTYGDYTQFKWLSHTNTSWGTLAYLASLTLDTTHQYQLSFWGKTEVRTGGSVQLSFRQSSDVSVKGAIYPNATSWTKYSSTFTPTSGAGAIVLHYNSAITASTLDIKDLVLKDVTTGEIVYTTNKFTFGEGDALVKATWTPNIYKVTLDNQSATTAGTAAYWYKYNTVIDGVYYYTNSGCTTALVNSQITPPTKTGYTFGGYWTGKNGTGTRYVDSNGTCINARYQVAGDVTLYAQWTPKNIHITLNKNGGTGGTDEFWFKYNSLNESDDYTIYSDSGCNTVLDADGFIDAPTKTGYVCNGYKKDGTTYISHNGICEDEMYEFTTETTLIADWTPIGYTVYYNSNGSGVEGDTANSVHTYDVAKELTPNGYTRPGYRFVNWNTSPDGTGTSYTNGQSVINLTTTNGGRVHLYAQWTPNVYRIGLDKAGGSGGLIAIFEKYGVGYYQDSETSIPFTTTTSISRPTKLGYTFGGYYTGENGTGTQYVTADGKLASGVSNTDFTEDSTLYAKWTPTVYTITLNKAGGSGGLVAIFEKYGVGYYQDSETSIPFTTTTSISRPTKLGYTFGGYYTGENGTGTQYVTADGKLASGVSNTDFTEDSTLYAKWTPTVYTITLNKAGGSGGLVSIFEKYGVGYYQDSKTSIPFTTTTSISRPTKPGYTFGGYYTGEDGTGTQYVTADGKLASGVSNTDFTEDSTLYAKWTLINYTITYNLNDGTVATANPTSYNAETPTFTLVNPTKPGYTFTGWTGTNGTTPQLTVTIEKGSTGDREYTANWTIATYDVLFRDSADGTSVVYYMNTANSTLTKIEDKLDIPAGTPTNLATEVYNANNMYPEKKDYVFTGWYKDEECKDAYGANQSVTEADHNGDDERTVILYAGWRKIENNLTLSSKDPAYGNENDDVKITGQSEFEMYGVQVRTTGKEYDENGNLIPESDNGMRFCIRVSDALLNDLRALDDRNNTEYSVKHAMYGFVTANADMMTAYGATNKMITSTQPITGSYCFKKTNSMRNFLQANDYTVYTAVVTGYNSSVTSNFKSKMETNIAIRPFIEYYDANGTMRTYYQTDSYSYDNAKKSLTIGGAYYANLKKVSESIFVESNAKDTVKKNLFSLYLKPYYNLGGTSGYANATSITSYLSDWETCLSYLQSCK